MIKINCDIGERGPDHPVDIALMEYIQIANIACGGHAGDQKSVNAFYNLAKQNGVEIAAHLSYPDRKNFGRTSMEISSEGLLNSLNEQIRLLPDTNCVKFHGALYNDAAVNTALAEILTTWLKNQKIKKVLAASTSKLADCCLEAGIAVLNEVFAERRYAYCPKEKQLTLVSRSKDYASISDCNEALDHSKNMICRGTVNAYIEDNSGGISRLDCPIKADTICIHSDSKIALDLAKAFLCCCFGHNPFLI